MENITTAVGCSFAILYKTLQQQSFAKETPSQRTKTSLQCPDTSEPKKTTKLNRVPPCVQILMVSGFHSSAENTDASSK